MLSVNIIDCRKEDFMELFMYVHSIFNKNSISDNIRIFEDINIKKIRVEKDDPH